MSKSANMRSLDAVRQFMAAVVQFQSEARTALAALDTQLNRTIFWLERDRPEFWKREIEKCMREAADARVRLHQCRMRRTGDFRPSCIEEVKELEKARRDLNFAQKQIPVVRQWRINALHEANEFHGRCSQLVQMLERELPQLLGLLQKSVERIETYAGVRRSDRPRSAGAVTRLAADLEREAESDTDHAASSPPSAAAAEERDTPAADDSRPTGGAAGPTASDDSAGSATPPNRGAESTEHRPPTASDPTDSASTESTDSPGSRTEPSS